MNYLKIFLCCYVVSVMPIIVGIDNFNEELIEDVFIPLKIEISLDFLKMEISKEEYEFKNDWNGQIAKNIVKKAELLVKNNPNNLQEKIKTKIISFFKDIDIDIFFTEDDLIVKKDTQGSQYKKQQDFFKNESDQPEEYISNHHDTDYKVTQPKKIKGARKTLKRLKKRYAEEKKAEEQRHHDMIEALHEYVKKQQEKKAKENLNTAPNKKNINHTQNEHQENETQRPTTMNMKKNIYTAKKQSVPSKPIEHTENVHFNINPELD